MANVLSKETTDQIKKILLQYPNALAGVVPALHIAQAQLGHVDEAAQLEIAQLLNVPATQVKEVASFYTMFHEKPAGRHTVRICRNLSCQLRGAERVMNTAKEILGVNFGETTKDGRITLEHEECLAACGTGPALWCDDHLVENLDETKLKTFLAGLT